MTTQPADLALLARKLTEAQRDFLDRVATGRNLGLADRAADKVRQSMRRLGLCRVAMHPRRWVATPLGIALRIHLQENSNG